MSKFPSKNSAHLVEQWANNLPLASTLSSLLPPNIDDVAMLTTEQIEEICRIFATDLKETLKNNCSSLKAALDNETRASNSKFATYAGNFGTISNFHALLYDEIGNPNPHWEAAMRKEHDSNTESFTTGNYGLTTCPRDEWRYVVDGVPPPSEAMGSGRVLQSIHDLMAMDVTSQAQLTRAEVIALVLYTGPMYVIFNAILRKYPPSLHSSLKDKDSMFPTTIFVMISAIQKVSRVMVLQPGQRLYRGVDGNMTLPGHFTKPDSHGCVGMMEFAFMSTTADINVAVSYSGVDKGRAFPKVFEISIGSVDRGADIHQFSQYPGEAEYLWTPHAFLEPVGGNEILVTQHGVVEVIKVRVNSNLKAVTLEEYEARKKGMHMASFKVLLQDLMNQMEERLGEEDVAIPPFLDDQGYEKQMSKGDRAKQMVSTIVAQCEEIRGRHGARGGPDFNDDTVYRGLVTEMLEMKTHAVVHLDHLLSQPGIWPSHLTSPLRVTYRDRMGQVGKMLSANSAPQVALALDLCKKYGLVLKGVDELNDLKETPLIAACADGVTDDKLELLLMAGCDVNAQMSNRGKPDDGNTALITSALHGRASLVQRLMALGADVNKSRSNGSTAVWVAAMNGHTACLQLLHKCGADVNRPNMNGSTPIFKAASGGFSCSVKLLHEFGADVNKSKLDGVAPLFIASLNGHAVCVELLVKLGADVNKPKNEDGVTPMFAAAMNGHAACVELLLKCGAQVNTSNSKGATPLYIAAHHGHTSVVAALLRNGADATIGFEGRTPLEVAVDNSHTNVVKLLSAANV